MNFENQLERVTRAVNSMQGGESIEPITISETDSSEIAELKAKVNELAQELDGMKAGPGVDLDEGDKLEPLIPEQNIIGQAPVLVDNTGAGIIIKLAESFLEGEDDNVEESAEDATETVFIAKITGESSGSYAWTEYTISTSDTLVALSDGRSGTTSSNAANELSGTEDLYIDDFYVFMHETFDADGVAHYRFTAGTIGTHDSPKAMYSTFEGSETAQTDTWDITNQGAYDGVTVYKHMRTVYGASEILYGFYRAFTYDSTGRLVAVSAETRYTIDTPEDCT